MRFHLRTFFIKYTARYASANNPVLIKLTTKPLTSTFPISKYIAKSPVKNVRINFNIKFFKIDNSAGRCARSSDPEKNIGTYSFCFGELWLQGKL